MRNYRINYIDGHDLRYKSFETVAENKDEALENLWASYKNGDFDHRIAEVIDLGEANSKEPKKTGYRIGAVSLSPIPFAKAVSPVDHNSLQ